MRARPTTDGSVSSWLDYHRRMAAAYTEIVDVDRFHHHEALYWANREREHADEIATRAAARPPSERD